MSTIARTEAAGGLKLLPEVLAFTSSLELDRALLSEDLVGSLAHLTMLARQGLIPVEAARTLKAGLLALWDEAAKGTLALPAEEDVHMAVEATLAQRLGDVSGLLHTARSRNDQVSLDLHLYVREQCAEVLHGLGELIELLAARAAEEAETVLPAYTHRQRAQPVSLGYYFAAYGAMFARDVEAFSFALSQADALPLGVGAIAGTSLGIDREKTQRLLGFSKLTLNGLDTVGDRDFALDFAYATSRMLLHASRVAADFIDFTSAEFGFATLDGEIACGSSMMPQKRNPDLFELIRGKSATALGNLTGLLAAVKGLPAGYNRDLQEDRRPLLETGALARGVVKMLGLGIPRVTFDRARCRRAVEEGALQATDLAEALVKRGMPFRTAYRAVGALVRRCQEKGLPLAACTPQLAREVDPCFDAEVLAAASVEGSVARKVSAGSTGPASVAKQLEVLRAAGAEAKVRASRVPRLSQLVASLRAETL